MQCPHCNARLEDDTVFCGSCGKQIAPFQAGPTATYKAGAGEDSFATMLSTRQDPQTPVPRTPAGNNAYRSDTPFRGDDLPTVVASPPPARKKNTGLIIFIVAMVLVIIGVGTLGTVAFLKNRNTTTTTNNGSTNIPVTTNANGTITFSDSQNGSGHSNVVTITARGLTAPPSGSQYDAWIVNTQSEQSTGLGTLQQNKDGTYTASFTSHHNLLGLGNRVEVTLEQGTAPVPTGQVVLAANYPPKAFVHIKHLVVSFPDTPGKIGLLVGLVDQAQKLSSAAQLLQSISASQNSFAITCAAQSIIDIAEGTHGAQYQPLTNCGSANIAEAGDGYGLLGGGGYIANSQAHASLAATQSDTTPTIRVHAGHVAICLQNMKGWVNTIDHDAQDLLHNPIDPAKVQEIVTLANHAYNGFDANGDGTIDPIPGEGGAVTAYFHGQLMAVLVLGPGQ